MNLDSEPRQVRNQAGGDVSAVKTIDDLVAKSEQLLSAIETTGKIVETKAIKPSKTLLQRLAKEVPEGRAIPKELEPVAEDIAKEAKKYKYKNAKEWIIKNFPETKTIEFTGKGLSNINIYGNKIRDIGALTLGSKLRSYTIEVKPTQVDKTIKKIKSLGGRSIKKISIPEWQKPINSFKQTLKNTGFKGSITDFYNQAVKGGEVKKIKPSVEKLGITKESIPTIKPEQIIKEALIKPRRITKAQLLGKVKPEIVPKSKKQLLKLRLREQAKGAKAGARFARQAERAKARLQRMELKEKIFNQIKERKTLAKAIKQDIKNYADMLRPEERGKLLNKIKNISENSTVGMNKKKWTKEFGRFGTYVD